MVADCIELRKLAVFSPALGEKCGARARDLLLLCGDSFIG
jgi:hypothetical protein